MAFADLRKARRDCRHAVVLFASRIVSQALVSWPAMTTKQQALADLHTLLTFLGLTLLGVSLSLGHATTCERVSRPMLRRRLRNA